VLEHVMAEQFGVPPRIDFPDTGMNYELNGSLDVPVDEQISQRSPDSSQERRS
jgi:hypothetical protein